MPSGGSSASASRGGLRSERDAAKRQPADDREQRRQQADDATATLQLAARASGAWRLAACPLPRPDAEVVAPELGVRRRERAVQEVRPVRRRDHVGQARVEVEATAAGARSSGFVRPARSVLRERRLSRRTRRAGGRTRAPGSRPPARPRSRARASGGRRAARSATAATVDERPGAHELRRRRARRRAPTRSARSANVRTQSQSASVAEEERQRLRVEHRGRSSPSPARSATNAAAPSSIRGRPRPELARDLPHEQHRAEQEEDVERHAPRGAGSPTPSLPASQSSDAGDHVVAGRRVVLALVVRAGARPGRARRRSRCGRRAS